MGGVIVPRGTTGKFLSLLKGFMKLRIANAVKPIGLQVKAIISNLATDPLKCNKILGANPIRIALGSIIFFPRTIQIHSHVQGLESDLASLVILDVGLVVAFVLPARCLEVLEMRGLVLPKLLLSCSDGRLGV